VEPLFRPREDRPGLTVIDPLDRSLYVIGTSRHVDPRPVSLDGFDAPVGAVARVRTDRIEFPSMVSAFVRDTLGELLVTIDHETAATLPSDEYYIELTTAVKTYLRVDSSLEFDVGEDELTLSFGDETAVEIGARSAHTRPAGTVTTTTEPEDVMATISSFGSALKTTSPERSFPTLRGHPPIVEFCDELHVPADLQPPETGVTIEVPPAFESIFPVASLAYYLGATVVPGDTPRIVTDRGTHPLTHPERGFEGEVARVLKQSLFFDCLTRTEGLYRTELHERQAVESLVALDFKTLYDASIPDRLDAYLDVPFSIFEDALPTWRLSVQTTAEPGNVVELPYVIRDLPILGVATADRESSTTVTTSTDIAAFTRSTEADRRYPPEPIPAEEYVVPPKTDTLERVARYGCPRRRQQTRHVRVRTPRRPRRVGGRPANHHRLQRPGDAGGVSG
jgi:hypothetical protein